MREVALGESAVRERGAHLRAAQRRVEILEAAAHCFNRCGFHGASMSAIAQEAAMSVGQIYRVFDSKEAVIEALVEHNLAEWRRRIETERARSHDLVEEMLAIARYQIEKSDEKARAGLLLEFLAEAARNPQIAAIVHKIDAAMRAHLRDVLLRHGGVAHEALDARAEMLAMLIDGWSARSVRNPFLDKEAYLSALRPLFARLLE